MNEILLQFLESIANVLLRRSLKRRLNLFENRMITMSVVYCCRCRCYPTILRHRPAKAQQGIGLLTANRQIGGCRNDLTPYSCLFVDGMWRQWRCLGWFPKGVSFGRAVWP